MTERTTGAWSNVRLRMARDVTSQEFDGEIVLVDLQRGQYYGLDGVGAVLWELLQREATLAEMVDAVTHRFAVDDVTCRQDVVQLLEQLAAAQLIETAPAPV